MGIVSITKLILILILFSTACVCKSYYSDRSRNFSIELIYFSQEETGGHVLLAPFGIWTMLVGVALGAGNISRKQIEDACRLPKDEDTWLVSYRKLQNAVLVSSEIELKNINLIFLDSKISVELDFRNIIKLFNFNNSESAATLANIYINEVFPGKLSVFTPKDFRDSQLIYTNIFKGYWKFPFNASDTRIEPFYDEIGNVAGEVNMMNRRAVYPHSSTKDLGADVVEIPYGRNKKYSMVVILPHVNMTANLVYQNFAKLTLPDILRRLQPNEVEISLPRFKITSNYLLNKPLNHMGIYDIFAPEAADLRFVSRDKIFVSHVVHVADMEVTDGGTINGAALYTFNQTNPFKMLANKPFVYFVIEKSTTTVIFAGFYYKPTVF